jgi:hypothetical protein
MDMAFLINAYGQSINTDSDGEMCHIEKASLTPTKRVGRDISAGGIAVAQEVRTSGDGRRSGGR